MRKRWISPQLITTNRIHADTYGEVYELDDPPKLDLRRKHTVEVVVDRFDRDVTLDLAELIAMEVQLADQRVDRAAIGKVALDKRRILVDSLEVTL